MKYVDSKERRIDAGAALGDRSRGGPLRAGAALSAVAALAAIALGGCSGRGAERADQAAAMSAQPSPEVLRGLPGYALEPLQGPLRIGIQPGHWKVHELPDELARLRASTGAAFGDLKEVDLNLAVSRLLVDRLAAAGYAAELVPAAVPSGYRADLFVSVHADRADRPDREGWKLAPPWRPSPRARELAEAMKSAFRASGLREDAGGITANMRGYFAFSWWRFSATLSPYTPAVLIEMGFMGNAADRARMRDHPELYADLILAGIRTYLLGHDRTDLDALVPVVYPGRFAAASGAAARSAPSFGAAVLERYDAGRYLRPVDAAEGGWLELFSRPHRRGVWVHESELEVSN